ncbi:MAG: class F sortase [Actinomycetota bacterium]|nr:class F sortase [Actinomycetota bacterium]
MSRLGQARMVRAGLLLGAGLLVGIIVSIAGGRSHSAPPLVVGPVARGRPSVSVAARVPTGFAPPVPEAKAPVARGQQPPVEVAVPVIAVRSRLVGLRLNPDRSLQVPESYSVAGWYSQGPAPGATGPPAIIVGHVDSTRGPGVFFKLRQLRPGDDVLVRRADGTTLRFVVYRTAQYNKTTFPAHDVYAGRPTPEVRLITCTGVFDRASGRYLSNYVVYAAEHALGSRS